MKCWIRVCKFNESEECKKYKTPEDMLEDFKKGGGCALTWFFTGQIPKVGGETSATR